MARYYFNLKDRRTIIRDSEGTELAGDDAARAHAVVVAREAMRNNEARTRSWRIQVCDENHAACFEVLFASVDETMELLPNEIRRSLTDVSRNFASLADAIQDVRLSMLQVRATLARTEGVPYLATLNGQRLSDRS